MKTSQTRKDLMHFAKDIIAYLDNNQVAAYVGAVAEMILIKHYKWDKNGAVGNEKGYDAIDDNGLKYEIKSMSYETKTPYVAYKHEAKRGKYDVLSILHFNEKRVSHIPSKEITKFLKTNKKPGCKTKSLRLCFSDELLTMSGKVREKSKFMKLFLKYEDKTFNF
tara:strand:- start:209 stop:703 length:495 start_codon:yes stop_codon:yes gene_type:complete